MPQGNQIQGNKKKKKVMFFKFLWVFCFNKKNKGLDIKEHKQQNSRYTPNCKAGKSWEKPKQTARHFRFSKFSNNCNRNFNGTCQCLQTNKHGTNIHICTTTFNTIISKPIYMKRSSYFFGTINSSCKHCLFSVFGGKNIKRQKGKKPQWKFWKNIPQKLKFMICAGYLYAIDCSSCPLFH